MEWKSGFMPPANDSPSGFIAFSGSVLRSRKVLATLLLLVFALILCIQLVPPPPPPYLGFLGELKADPVRAAWMGLCEIGVLALLTLAVKYASLRKVSFVAAFNCILIFYAVFAVFSL